jgi:DNA-binding transcriptional ArsR family regulator
MPKQSAALKSAPVNRLDRTFHALADPARRAMVARLARGPATVSELARPLPMSLPAVVQHLKVLEDSGVVASQKRGRVRTCRLEPGALSGVQTWLDEQRALWEARLDSLEAYLETMKTEETPDE